MVKTAAAQDPHAWPRPCPLSLERCWALCTGNLGQAVTVLCSKSADTKLDILNSSCSVLFNCYFNYHRLAANRNGWLIAHWTVLAMSYRKFGGSIYRHCILAVWLVPASSCLRACGNFSLIQKGSFCSSLVESLLTDRQVGALRGEWKG